MKKPMINGRGEINSLFWCCYQCSGISEPITKVSFHKNALSLADDIGLHNFIDACYRGDCDSASMIITHLYLSSLDHNI